jgi:hypothetical protein
LGAEPIQANAKVKPTQSAKPAEPNWAAKPTESSQPAKTAEPAKPAERTREAPSGDMGQRKLDQNKFEFGVLQNKIPSDSEIISIHPSTFVRETTRTKNLGFNHQAAAQPVNI